MDVSPAPSPMDGLVVVDFSTIVAGPWATRLMADAGAEVIKIEALGEGDLLRHAPPVFDGMSRVFAQFNRGKKSVALDLKAPADLALARALIDGADVLVENFRPGTMERLGLGWDAVRASNPRLIYCSVSGFGQDGPLAQAASYAPVAHAMSGFDHASAAARGGDDDEPGGSGVMIADVVAAAYAFGAVQSALLRRERFGEGALVDVSLLESMMSLVGMQYQEAQAPAPARSAVFRYTRTADGYIVAPIVTLRNYRALFALTGRPEWLEDAMLTHMGGFAGRARDVAAHLGAWCADKTSARCVRELNEAGLACGPCLAARDVISHPHLAARGAFAEMIDADGPFVVLEPPFRISGAPPAAEPSAPRLGDHTALMRTRCATHAGVDAELR